MMRPTTFDLRARFKRRRPSSLKNPRKLKKMWKKVLMRWLQAQYGRSGKHGRYRLHWVPVQGWTVTVTSKEKLRHLHVELA